MQSNKNLFFSIITVCFNAEKTICKTISSIINQTYSNYEYIIIDGKSTDNTIKVINKFKPILNKKLKVISEADNGIYDAMNKGIMNAKGDIIGIINSDDWYESKSLEIINNYYTSTNKNGIYYGLLNSYKKGQFYKVECVHHSYLNEAPLFHPTCFVSKQVYDSIGLFNLKYKLAADYDFFLKARSKSINFIYIPEILANFSLDGLTTLHKKKSISETIDILYNYRVITKYQKQIRKFKIFIKSIIGNFF